MIYSTDMLLY